MVTYFAANNETFFLEEEVATTKAYYDKLCAGRPFEVRYTGPERGKAMFATKAYKKGDTILEEYGWVGMQAVVNKRVARVCSFCYRFLGTVVSQLEHLLGRELSETERQEVGEAAGISRVEAEGRVRTEVPCARPEAKQAFEAFYDHADDTNEIFVMAAKTYARIAIDVRERGLSLKEALIPLRLFVKDYWWNIMEIDEDEDRNEFEGTIQQVLSDSISLLRAALPFPEIEPLFSVDFYALLIGLFERNNLSIEVPHPILGCFDHLPPWLQNHVVDSIRKALEDVGTSCPCGHDHAQGDPHHHIGHVDHDHLANPHIHVHDETCNHDHPQHGNDRKSFDTRSTSSTSGIPPPPSSSLLPGAVPHRDASDADAESDARSALSATRTFVSTTTGYQTLTSENDPLRLLDALHCEGTALHPLQATINHSCSPNAKVVAKDLPTPHLLPESASGVTDGRWKGKSVGGVMPDERVGGGDGRTVVVAKGDIAVGEEILISYVDEDGGGEEGEGSAGEEEDVEEKREERRKALREYGVECGCVKCRG
ncbi:hypothetical protein HDV00_004626 [Rhizophlyctis rosea]|nr:hypothetical protein HDV00_004626 [Rhizophlyctis rosea]